MILRLAVALLLVALILLVGTYVILPPILERGTAAEIKQNLGLQRTPVVELDMGSPVDVVAGRFDGGTVSLGAADLGGVRAERITFDLDPFDLNLPASLLGGDIESEGPISGALRAEIPESEVSRLAEAGADVPVRGVDLEEDEVIVDSEVPVLGVYVPVSVTGDVALRDQSLAFLPRRVSALGAPVPDGLVEQLLATTNFSYPLGELPYGAEVTGVDAREGRLVVSGVLERIPLRT